MSASSANLGVLLYGPPGTGKTMLAKAIARECGVNFLPIQGPEIFSQWLGESEESIRHVFNVARRAAPCIVFFDQLDAVAPKRSDLEHEGTRAPQRVVNQLLAELDGMESRSQVIVIGATNRIAMVDPAALRPGRFGVHLQVGLPDASEREEILQIHLADAELEVGLSLGQLVSHVVAETEGDGGGGPRLPLPGRQAGGDGGRRLPGRAAAAPRRLRRRAPGVLARPH